MIFPLWIILIICSVTALTDLFLIIFWLLKPEPLHRSLHTLPFISILVAARNEEDNIGRCIESLLRLDYPKENIEILVGDDQSGDRTPEIAREYSEIHPQVRVSRIIKNIKHTRGKANVLAHLSKQAQGKYLFFTDADIAVPKSWVRGMLADANENVGIVTGVTGVEKSVFQHLDWLFALGMIKVITDLNQPVTAMGNNMMVTREAYDAVGGFEGIPYSITEDFELFRHIKRKGYKVVQRYDQTVLAFSMPVKGISLFFHQRKRWMQGAVQLPWRVVMALTFQALYYPGIVVLFFLDVDLAIKIFLVKGILQSIFLFMAQHQLGQKWQIAGTVFYEIYSLGISILSSLFYLLPVKTVWKGRKY